jgi:spore germination protein KB
MGQKFPGKTLVEYTSMVLGRVLGKILGMFIVIYFFIVAASTVTMYIHHLTDFLLPQTPFLVVTALHVFVICYLVWKGPEVVGRTAVVAYGTAIAFFILVFMASLAEINFGRLTPFFDSGVGPVFKASLVADTFTGKVPLIAAMLLPLVQDQKKAYRSAVSGLLIGGSFFIFYFIVELMVMGPQLVAMMRIPSMDFVRSIQITQYLHRFESFMVALWYWSIMIQAGSLASCSLEGFMKITGIKKRNLLTIIIFGLLLIIVTYYMGHDRVLFLKLRENVWQYFSIPIDFGIPLILFSVFGLKKIFKPGNKKK